MGGAKGPGYCSSSYGREQDSQLQGHDPVSSSKRPNEARATKSRWGQDPQEPQESYFDWEKNIVFYYLTLRPLPSVPLLEELLQLDLPPPVEDPPPAVELPAADAGV